MGYAPQLYQGAPYEAYAGATGVPPAPVGPEYEAPYAEAGAPYYGNNWLPGYGYFPSPYFGWGRASHGREFIPARAGTHSATKDAMLGVALGLVALLAGAVAFIFSAAARAPIGYEDEGGFHLGPERFRVEPEAVEPAADFHGALLPLTR